MRLKRRATNEVLTVVFDIRRLPFHIWFHCRTSPDGLLIRLRRCLTLSSLILRWIRVSRSSTGSLLSWLGARSLRSLFADHILPQSKGDPTTNPPGMKTIGITGRDNPRLEESSRFRQLVLRAMPSRDRFVVDDVVDEAAVEDANERLPRAWWRPSPAARRRSSHGS